jgi:hypothetical protein
MPSIRIGDIVLWRHVVAILAVALALRAVAVAFYAEAPCSDPADYHCLAENVVREGGYGYGAERPSAFRACGYPLFLAGIYRVSGVNWFRAECVQVVLGGGSVLLTMVLAWLIVGRREGLLTGYIAAVYPSFVWLPRLLLSENLSLLLQLAALCAVALVLRRPRAPWVLALGFLLGLNMLTRGASVFLVTLIVSGIAATTGRRPFDRTGLRLASIALTAAALMLAPWAARNYSLFHHFVPIANDDGITMYISYWPVRASGKAIWGNVPGAEDPVVAEAYQAENEALMSRQLRKVTLLRLLKHPAHAFQLMPVKVMNLLVPFDWEIIPHWNGRSRSVNLGYLFAIAPAILGAWVLWRRRAPYQWVLWVSPISVVILAVVFYGSPRFRLPAEPVLLIFASSGFCFLWEKVAGWSSGYRAPNAQFALATGDH